MLRKTLTISLSIVCLMAVSSQFAGRSGGLIAAGFDRPKDTARQGRSVVLARHGIVATSHPLASQAGLEILQAGGTAADAAITANAMLGLVEPMSCGIGGDLFVLYWDNKTKKLYGLNASGRSPYEMTRDEFRQRDMKQIPEEGVLSWSVPGCVSGWEELHGRFGTLEMSQLLAPAIAAAEEGTPVPEVIAGYWSGAEESLRRWPDSAATYLIDGKRAPRFGEVFQNPRLAATYRKIAEGGADAFYRGDIAERIVEFSRKHGGFFSMRDFEDHTSEWVEPVSTTYRGYDVWELPPNGQGIAVLQMLNMLEPYELRSLGPGHPDYLHLFTEAKKLAFADRAKFYADPAFEKLPTEELISKEYARRRAQRIKPKQAASDVPAGDPRLGRSDTIYLTVVDKDRNCCSLIQSIYYSFGSKVTPGDVGFVMQNRGQLFALEDDHLNRLEPHKRPFHTIIPAMVTRDGRPWLSFGVMGGDMQPQGHVQVLVNLIDFGMNVQEAGDAARIRHDGSPTPTGLPGQGSGVVLVESGITGEAVKALRDKGHTVMRARDGYGGYQGIMIDWQQGVLHGATESRKDGVAAGY